MTQKIHSLARLIRTHRYAVMAGLVLILWGLTSPAQGLTHAEQDGTATYTQNFANSSTITVTGGDATFTGRLRNNSTVNVSGGTALFSGDLDNNVVFNLSGGSTTISSVKNNATFNVTGGEIILNEPLGNNASLDVNGGTLTLGADDVFSNNTDITLTDSTLNTNGNNFSIESLTLSGTSTIDLGDDPDATINLGDISGDGTLVVTGYVETSQIQFDQDGSTIDVGSQVQFGTVPGMIGEDGTIVPVPEPATIMGGALLGLFLLGFEIYRRKKGLHKENK